MKKNMAAFQLTGRHPELEAAQAERDSALPTLPERDINHSFVFLDISIGGKPAGESLHGTAAEMRVVAWHFQRGSDR